ATCGAAVPRSGLHAPARSSPAPSSSPGNGTDCEPPHTRENSAVIAFLSGRVVARGAETAGIDVGGVGMTGHCAPAALARPPAGGGGRQRGEGAGGQGRLPAPVRVRGRRRTRHL